MQQVYSLPELRVALSQESGVFQVASHDFSLIMKATERNPNILQCCQRASECRCVLALQA